MKFRPCIDIHNGKVKQIVGSSLVDDGDQARENFVADQSAADFARLFRRDNLTGGHVILLNSRDSDYYEATRREAMHALAAFPEGLQVGGGITADNASEYLEAGASHVIVTSYVFKDGKIAWDHLERLENAVGPEHIVLDLSCKKKPGEDLYYICTDRWQHFTDTPLDAGLIRELAAHCGEFLVHGISVEGKGSGIDADLVALLGEYAGGPNIPPITYAGGIRSWEDIRRIGSLGGSRIDYTVGSALDLFGGGMEYAKLSRGDVIL